MLVKSFDGLIDIGDRLRKRLPLAFVFLEDSKIVVDDLIEKAFLLINVYYSVPKFVLFFKNCLISLIFFCN